MPEVDVQVRGSLAGRYINQLEIDVGINTRLVLKDGRTDVLPPNVGHSLVKLHGKIRLTRQVSGARYVVRGDRALIRSALR